MNTSSIEEVHLLVVDDDTIRLVLTRAFSVIGYQVTAVDSGKAALACLEEANYDLMLLDLHMPGMDGIEVMHRAHEIQPELQIIILTGYPTLESAITSIKCDVADYLQKPASINTIIDAVTRSLLRRAASLQKEKLDRFLQDSPQPLNQTEAHSSPFLLNQARRSVEIVGQYPRTVQLTRGEMAILSSFMAYPDNPLSCQRLVQMAWGEKLDKAQAENIVRPYISRLRQKLEADPKRPRILRTIRGNGYLFTPNGK